MLRFRACMSRSPAFQLVSSLLVNTDVASTIGTDSLSFLRTLGVLQPLVHEHAPVVVSRDFHRSSNLAAVRGHHLQTWDCCGIRRPSMKLVGKKQLLLLLGARLPGASSDFSCFVVSLIPCCPTNNLRARICASAVQEGIAFTLPDR